MSNNQGNGRPRLKEYINSDEWDDVIEDRAAAATAVLNADPDESQRLRNALIRYQALRDYVQIQEDRANEATP